MKENPIVLRDTNYINERMSKSIESDCLEILKILYSIIRTSRRNASKKNI
jgi:hypothetical protein